jgi:hypothetical protein
MGEYGLHVSELDDDITNLPNYVEIGVRLLWSACQPC